MIYIIKHIKYNNPVPDGYSELYVGDLYQGREEYINKLNVPLSEASGLYEMWKHGTDKIVGLCHYRRFFLYEENILQFEDAEKLLKDYDIIVAPKVVFESMTLYDQIKREVEPTPILDKYLNMVYEKEPGFKEYMENEYGFNNREMFVCKRGLMEQYCEWMFSIMLPIVEQFVKEDYDYAMNKRLPSHIIERLFSYWLYKNNLNILEMEYIDI